MWDIFNYAGIRQNIADAVLATLKAFGLAAVGSLVLGVVLAVARISDHKPVRWVATAFIELFRSIPLLITIYGVWVGFLTDYSMWALALGLSIYNGCVQAEVLRAGVNSVPKGPARGGVRARHEQDAGHDERADAAGGPRDAADDHQPARRHPEGHLARLHHPVSGAARRRRV